MGEITQLPHKMGRSVHSNPALRNALALVVPHPHCTNNVNDIVCFIVPADALIVMVYVPAGVALAGAAL